MAIPDIKTAQFHNHQHLQERHFRPPCPLVPRRRSVIVWKSGSPFPTWAAGALLALGDCLTFNPLVHAASMQKSAARSMWMRVWQHLFCAVSSKTHYSCDQPWSAVLSTKSFPRNGHLCFQSSGFRSWRSLHPSQVAGSEGEPSTKRKGLLSGHSLGVLDFLVFHQVWTW